MLTIRVDEGKCIECGACRAVCSLGHGIWNGAKQIDCLPEERVVIKSRSDGVQIDICRHCETPVCVNACVAGALNIDGEAGIVKVVPDRCVCCWSCIMECPFCALRIRSFAWKCDGCSEWDRPLCATYCPTGALTAEKSPRQVSAEKRKKRMTQ